MTALFFFLPVESLTILSVFQVARAPPSWPRLQWTMRVLHTLLR